MPDIPAPTRAVAVIPVGGEATAGAADLARALAARGVPVVLVAGESEHDLDAAGRLAAEVAASGNARPAVFTPPDAVDGLVELLGELYPAR